MANNKAITRCSTIVIAKRSSLIRNLITQYSITIMPCSVVEILTGKGKKISSSQRMSHVRVVNSAAAQLGIQVPKRVKGSVSAGLDLKKYEIANKVIEPFR